SSPTDSLGGLKCMKSVLTMTPRHCNRKAKTSLSSSASSNSMLRSTGVKEWANSPTRSVRCVLLPTNRNRKPNNNENSFRPRLHFSRTHHQSHDCGDDCPGGERGAEYRAPGRRQRSRAWRG